MPKPPITEVYATVNGREVRVYRGSNPEHIAWKMNHHKSAGAYSREIPQIDEELEPGE